MKTYIKEITEQNLLAAAEIIKGGGVAAFPTETVYGIGGMPEAVYRLKGREAGKPLTLHVSDKSRIYALAEVGARERKIIERFLPGALTVVLNKKGGGGTLGFRLPAHEGARRLIELCGGTLYASSANRSGRAPAVTAREVYEEFKGEIPLVLDGGRTGGAASAVVDLTGAEIKILRDGSVGLADICDIL